MTDKSTLLKPEPSPTGEPVVPPRLVPPRLVPYVLASISVLIVLADAFAVPGTWTVERVLRVAAQVLGVLIAGALPWLRR